MNCDSLILLPSCPNEVCRLGDQTFRLLRHNLVAWPETTTSHETMSWVLECGTGFNSCLLRSDIVSALGTRHVSTFSCNVTKQSRVMNAPNRFSRRKIVTRTTYTEVARLVSSWSKSTIRNVHSPRTMVSAESRVGGPLAACTEGPAQRAQGFLNCGEP